MGELPKGQTGLRKTPGINNKISKLDTKKYIVKIMIVLVFWIPFEVT